MIDPDQDAWDKWFDGPDGENVVMTYIRILHDETKPEDEKAQAFMFALRYAFRRGYEVGRKMLVSSEHPPTSSVFPSMDFEPPF